MPNLMTLHRPLAAGLLMLVTCGCGNLMTARAIQTFADGVATGDLDMLRGTASSEFDHKALRSAEALDDLKILNLPTGKVSIANIVDVSETEKRVTVAVGERQKKVLYKLTKSPRSDEWLIDDIYLKQRKSADGEVITKSVTETMDLLLTVREFLDNWQDGGREDVLAVTTTDFGALLIDLSPVHLQQLTTQVVGKAQRGSNRPEARIEDDRAVVMLPRTTGKVIIELKLVEDRWLVNDVAVDSNDKELQVRSARRLAYILRTGNRFLSAYEQMDMDALQEVCKAGFYDNSLAVADLSSVPLPTLRLLSSPYNVRVNDEQADLIVESPDATYILTLNERKPGSIRQKIGVYEVSEVTIYDNDGAQIKRLSALFTAHAMLDIFSEALANRDLARLKQSSTMDFNAQVWNLVDTELLNSLPMDEVEAARPTVVATVFQGELTEITVTQGTRALTYVLRDAGGRMAIDDVLLPVVNRPNSLKQNLRAMIPVYSMARAFFNNDVQAIRKISSRSLTKAVWEPLGGIPHLGVDPVRHLTQPVTLLTMTEDRADVTLGTGDQSTQLTLRRVDNRFVVGDAAFITGAEAAQRIDLRSTGQLNLTAGAIAK